MVGSVTVMHQGHSRFHEPVKLEFESQRKRIQSFLPDELSGEDKGFKLSRNLFFQEPPGAVVFTKSNITKFATGSKYIGEWNDLGISGRGIYKFPHGVIYDGTFNENGEFHGRGVIIYPNGQKLEGFWKNGKLTSGTPRKDNFVSNTDYCQMPDRRFQVEIDSDLQPASQEYRTNEKTPKVIPDGCYDAGEGFYDPQRRTIRHYTNTSLIRPMSECHFWLDNDTRTSYLKILHVTPSDLKLIHRLSTRYASKRDPPLSSLPKANAEDWIKASCRKAWDEPIGYMPELYEKWTTGRAKLGLTGESESSCLIAVKSPKSRASSVFSANFEDSFDVCFELDTLLSIVQESEDKNFATASSQMRSLMFNKTVRADVLNKLIFRQLHQLSVTKGDSKTSKYHGHHYIRGVMDSKYHVVRKLT